MKTTISFLRQKAWLIAFLLTSIATFFVDWKLRTLAVDDAYIHLRIAQQYAATGVAWYNIGERVNASSAPLWTLLLAVVYKLFRTWKVLPAIEALLTGASAAFAVLLAQRLAPTREQAPEEPRAAAWLPIQLAGAALLTWISLLQVTVSQMEAPLAVALLLAGLWQLSGPELPGRLNEKSNAGLALLVLAAMTRLELGLFALLAAVALVLARRLKWRTMVLADVAAALGALWVYLQFGSLVPNTVSAKSKAYAVAPFTVLSHFLLHARLLPVFFLLLIILGWGLARESRKQTISYAALSLAAWGILLTALYVKSGVWVFTWYLPVVVLPFTLGIWLLPGERSGKLVKACAFILVVWVAATMVSPTLRLFQEIAHGAQDHGAARVHEYLAVGTALNEACPSGVLLTSEIGGLGYTFHGKILDGMGLITPAAVAYHPLHFPQDSPSHDQGAIPPRYAEKARADLIVTYRIHGESVIQLAPQMGYVDISLPGFLPGDHIPPNQQARYGDMHVLVKTSGVCSVARVRDALRTELQPR